MKINKIIFLPAICAIMLLIGGCEKKADYYYAKYLDEAEVALPAKVDSLQILPGFYRAKLKYKVAPDKRVKKIRISYGTSVSAAIITSYTDVAEGDYGKFKEIELKDLPEATLLANVVTFSVYGDSSNTTYAVGSIYGERYRSVLGNRIFSKVGSKDGKKGIFFLEEKGKPVEESRVFYPLQNTIITYPLAAGGTKTIELSLYKDFIETIGIAGSGTIKHYSNYKPTENSIDVFKSNEVTVTF